MPKNDGLSKAKSAKKDEFYTQLTDIEKEMGYYKEHFKNAVVFCNCDDPETSNFWKYFELNFDFLGLKKLMSTHYDAEQPTYKLEMTRGVDVNGDGKMDQHDIVRTRLEQNGDFRSPECLELLDEADIVITNPPFSLFREYLDILIKHGKKFLIIGNVNAISYKEVFPLMKDNKMWLGASIHSGDREFRVPDDYPLNASGTRIDEQGNKYIRVKGVRWFTNLDYPQRHEDLELYKKYSADDFPKYDNYEAINVDKVADIPEDYIEGVGIPAEYKDKIDNDIFQIVSERKSSSGKDMIWLQLAGGERERERERACSPSRNNCPLYEGGERGDRDLQRSNGCADYIYGQIQSGSVSDIGYEPSLFCDSSKRSTETKTTNSQECRTQERPLCTSFIETKIRTYFSFLQDDKIEVCNGIIGVPITFIDKYNPEQFEIIGADYDLAGAITDSNGKVKPNPQRMYVKGKRLYSRILIKKRTP